MKVAIVNAFGANRGDEAMLSALVLHIKEQCPGVKIEIFASSWLDLTRHDVVIHKRFTQNSFLSGSVWRSKLAATLSLLFPGLVKSFGVKHLADVDKVISSPAGPYLSDQIGLRPLSLLPLATAIGQGVDYCIVATSAGPFPSKFNRIIRKRLLNHAKFWSLREAISKKHVEGLGLTTRILQGYDIVFTHKRRAVELYTDTPAGQRLREEIRRFNDTPTIVVTVNMTDHFDAAGKRVLFNKKDYTKRMITLLTDVIRRTGCRICLFPHFYGNAQEIEMLTDIKVGVGISDRVDILDASFNAEMQMELYYHAKFAISHRYHPTIFAAKSRVPFWCIRHEFKVDGMLKPLEPFGPVTQTDDGLPKWMEDFKQSWEMRDSLKAILLERVPEIEAKADLHLELVSAFLAGKPVMDRN